MPVAQAKPAQSLLNPVDHALILIDHQSQMAFATKSIDAVELRNNAALIANAAAGFNVPTILTTVAEKSFSGPMFDEITAPFPGQKMLDRTSMNTWEDAAVVASVAMRSRIDAMLASALSLIWSLDNASLALRSAMLKPRSRTLMSSAE